MPCSDGGPTEAQVAQSKLDVVTRLLCQACQANAPEPGTELAVWWARHQREDAIRDAHERQRVAEHTERRERAIKLEAARLAARAKLSADELEALGLK